MADQGFNKVQVKQLESLFDKNRKERRGELHYVVETLSETIQGTETRLSKRIDDEAELLRNEMRVGFSNTEDQIKALATTTPTVYQVNNHEVRIGKIEKRVFGSITA